jgi:hypothetical protein
MMFLPTILPFEDKQKEDSDDDVDYSSEFSTDRRQQELNPPQVSNPQQKTDDVDMEEKTEEVDSANDEAHSGAHPRKEEDTQHSIEPPLPGKNEWAEAWQKIQDVIVDNGDALVENEDRDVRVTTVIVGTDPMVDTSVHQTTHSAAVLDQEDVRHIVDSQEFSMKVTLHNHKPQLTANGKTRELVRLWGCFERLYKRRWNH